MEERELAGWTNEWLAVKKIIRWKTGRVEGKGMM